MQKKILFTFIVTILFLVSPVFNIYANEDFLNISANVYPSSIKQGDEGVIIIKITPKNGIKISSFPNFMIKLNPSDNLIFSKQFFTASELNVETEADDNTVFLKLEKKNEIGFKVSDSALIGKINISGDIIFTAVFEDNWSLKTRQPFNVGFYSVKNDKPKKK